MPRVLIDAVHAELVNVAIRSLLRRPLGTLRLRPNHPFNRARYGRPLWPELGHALHSRSAGQGILPARSCEYEHQATHEPLPQPHAQCQKHTPQIRLRWYGRGRACDVGLYDESSGASANEWRHHR